jgi:Holliday junction resolvasome RuvABC DNA-binding subunit
MLELIIGCSIGWLAHWMHNIITEVNQGTHHTIAHEPKQQIRELRPKTEKSTTMGTHINDAISVLSNLGYNKNQAKLIINSISGTHTTEELIKIGLSKIQNTT